MSNKTDTYSEHYKLLEEINQKLHSDHEKPYIIDQLAPMLEQASKSYKICKSRIDGAEKLIAKFEKQIELDKSNID